MEFIIIGILTGICLALAYDKYKQIKSKPKQTLTEEEQRKKQEQQEHYDNMLNYNASKAYGGNG